MENPCGTAEHPLYLIPTWTRKIIEINNPKPEDFDIADIAHALPMICRWGAQDAWISVAAHSVAMARYEMSHGNEFSLEALMHDAAEAYLGDTIGSLRRYLNDLYLQRGLQSGVLGDLEAVHDAFSAAIATRFKMVRGYEHLFRVKQLDEMALQAEVYRGVGRVVWDLPATNPMFEFLERAASLEDGGSLAGRDRIHDEFIHLFQFLKR
jgi:hypothetical protein